MNKMRLKIIIFILASQVAVQGYARDLGIFGQVYPIQEEDFLEFIMHRLNSMKENGEWTKLQTEFQQKVAKSADRPHPVSGLTRTIESKSWSVDPSIMIPYDIQDANGRVFAKAGSTVNPLHYVTLHNILIFIDGDDSTQIAWAEDMNKKLSGKTKLILVNGSVSDLVQRYKKPIYFDQAGKLTTRFKIQHVPALVQQDGLYLKVLEMAL